MPRPVRTVVAALIFACAAPLAAFAQIQTGSILVKAVDQQGAVIPGASVTMTSPVLPTPLSGVPCATLSTGSDIVVGDRYAAIDADLVDMETFAVLRACQRFGVPMMGLRGVSDGPSELDGVSGWTELLPLLDERLASAVDLLVDWLATEGRTSSGS